jgi:hypothetical protein
MFQLHLYKHAHIVLSILVLHCLALSLFSGSFKTEVRNNPSNRRNWCSLLTTFLSPLVMISIVQLYDVAVSREIKKSYLKLFLFLLIFLAVATYSPRPEQPTHIPPAHAPPLAGRPCVAARRRSPTPRLIHHGQRPGRRGSGWASLLVRGNQLPPRSPPPSTGSPTSSSHHRRDRRPTSRCPRRAHPKLAPWPSGSRPAAGFGDFGLPDTARCQARPQGQDSFLHPFVSQAFQSEA